MNSIEKSIILCDGSLNLTLEYTSLKINLGSLCHIYSSFARVILELSLPGSWM